MQHQLEQMTAEIAADAPLAPIRLDELADAIQPSGVGAELDQAAAEILPELAGQMAKADATDARIVAVLRAAGPEGARLRQIVDTADLHELHRSTWSRRLAALVDAGVVTKPAQGRYAVKVDA
jgi:hypothetical protein